MRVVSRVKRKVSSLKVQALTVISSPRFGTHGKSPDGCH